MAKIIKILLVEDNPADADLTREELEACKLPHVMDVAPDGVEAMAYLRKEGKYAEAPRPDIVLLDLNLPLKDGCEVLADIKADPALRSIPVIILTSSDAEKDVAKSYDLQASAYVTKPVDLTGFGNIVNAIKSFWFSVVRFPSK